MIQVVPTGDLGLDVLTGGGWRLVKRYKDRASATIVVRGGPGAGKTLMGIQVALELAKALGGDVAVGCVEILPTEYIAQLQSVRPSLEAARVVQLPAHVGDADGPRMFIGLLTSLDPDEPDLVANLEALSAAVEEAGGKPAVFIVDSLIEGYGIGSSIDRIEADAVIKFAVHGGYGLVLCEEVGADGPSPWVFAADTVLQLGVDSRPRGRWIEVRKHRFGPSTTGRHELDLGTIQRPRVTPAVGAWSPRRLGWVLDNHGWKHSGESRASSVLSFDTSNVDEKELPDLRGAFVYISSDNPVIAQSVAYMLRRPGPPSRHTLLMELDPLFNGLVQWWRPPSESASRGNTIEGVYLPSADGPAATLRILVERMGGAFGHADLDATHILLGDLGLVMTGSASEDWADAVREFATLVLASNWGVPVIAYDGGRSAGGEARARLRAQADISIVVDTLSDRFVVTIDQRWPRQTHRVRWSTKLEQPRELAATYRPFGRDDVPRP